jgi:acetate---CoA ligase (ADP-forming)
MRDITPLVAPRSIAVIGASSNPNKAGGMLFSNLARGGFPGKLYPINANSKEVMGFTAYPTVADVPETIDLVYVVVPRQHVESAIQQCAAAGARAACIVTAGFSERGKDGLSDEKRLREIAQASNLLLAGPNTIGMVNADCGMMGSFVHFPRWEKGGVSLFLQTGIFTGGVALYVMAANTQRLPMSKSIDVGNKIDVDEIDFLDYAASDPDTKVVGLYLERIDDQALFLAKAEALRKKKPIVVLRPGRTKEGAVASIAHTGSPLAERGDFDAELARRGIVKAEDEEEFVDALRALAFLPRAKGKRVGIATTSGALGVISTDLVVENGLAMASFSPETLKTMRTIIPDWMEPANPCDFWVSVDIKGGREAHETALSAVFADPHVDLVLCTLLAAATADFPEFGPLLKRLRATHDKPAALVIYGGPDRDRWLDALEGSNVPVFGSSRAAVKALAAVAHATI